MSLALPFSLERRFNLDSDSHTTALSSAAELIELCAEVNERYRNVLNDDSFGITIYGERPVTGVKLVDVPTKTLESIVFVCLHGRTTSAVVYAQHKLTFCGAVPEAALSHVLNVLVHDLGVEREQLEIVETSALDKGVAAFVLYTARQWHAEKIVDGSHAKAKKTNDAKNPRRLAERNAPLETGVMTARLGPHSELKIWVN